MRKIDRSKEPQEFVEFIRSKKPRSWDRDFVSAEHNLYCKCRGVLEADQMGLSGYTELILSKKKNIIHIDHFLKRDLFPQLTFDWCNLVIDDHNNGYGADYKDRRIKNIGQNQNLINPIKEDPHDFFTYQESGRIIPLPNLSVNNRERAEFTINSFNLNNQYLVRKRLSLIKSVEDYKSTMNKMDILNCMKRSYMPSVVEYCCKQ